MNLTLKPEWLEAGFHPASLYEGPFVEMKHKPLFDDVAKAKINDAPTEEDLEEFGRLLADALLRVLSPLADGRPVHMLMSGGYDSRAVAHILVKELGVDALFVSDGTQEPSCGRTLDALGVPANRRYVHDLSRPDPYGLVDARCDGWGPIYSQLTFTPADREGVTLVTGLGGGEWFSYPAADWHRGKPRRVPHNTVRRMWLDCWPQFAMLPVAWARGYAAAIHPYCTVTYAKVASRARPEWLHENTGYPTLDAVRMSLLDAIDPTLKTLGWEPHRYDWRLSRSNARTIDDAFAGSWLAREFGLSGRPSLMDADDHACTLAGFAQWCDQLIEGGAVISCS